MEKYVLSDLIMENSRMQEDVASGEERLGYSEDTYGDIRVCRVSVGEDGSGDRYSAKKGRYVTVYTPSLYSLEDSSFSAISDVVARELAAMLSKFLTERGTVLVAGIGNRRLAADSLGALTAEKVSVTRYVELIDGGALRAAGVRPVCALACDVPAQTGMQSAELLRGIVDQVRPDAVIAVDALAARHTDRLASTVQISDSGISPGAGIGGKRYSVDRESLGVPVVAVGVPVVVSAATLICDTLGGVRLDRRSERLLEAQKNFFVAPKECDVISEQVSELLARSIGKALGVI